MGNARTTRSRPGDAARRSSATPAARHRRRGRQRVGQHARTSSTSRRGWHVVDRDGPDDDQPPDPTSCCTPSRRARTSATPRRRSRTSSSARRTPRAPRTARTSSRAVFIVRVKPPSNYMGPAQLFGVAGATRPTASSARRCRSSARRGLRDGSGPPQEGRRARAVPPSLRGRSAPSSSPARRARARGQGRLTTSMLVHVTRFLDVQAQSSRPGRDELLDGSRRLRVRRGRESRHLKARARGLWEADFVPTTRPCRGVAGRRCDGRTSAAPLAARPASWS